MEQIILNIKDERKISFLKELLKRLEFVEVVEPKKFSVKEKKSFADLDEAINYVNKYKNRGTKAGKPVQFGVAKEDMIDGIIAKSRKYDSKKPLDEVINNLRLKGKLK